MATETKLNLKRKSHVVSDGPSRAPASDVTPCNVHLDRLARKV